MEIVIGIDIGGTKTKIGLVDKNGKCHVKTFFRTREFPDLDTYLDKIRTTSEELVESLGKKVTVLGCGIGAPNASS